MWDPEGRGGKTFKKYAGMANKFRAKGMEQEKKEKAAKAMKEETIDEVVVNRQMTPKEKAARSEYLKKHSEKLAGHDTGVTPKKSFKDVNTERGDYTHQPSKMGLRHAMGAGYYKAEEVEHVAEVLTKSTSAGETIHDFVHSDNPKFKGKSKEERKKMALAAYYSKQREQKEEVVNEAQVPGTFFSKDMHDRFEKMSPEEKKKHLDILVKLQGHSDAMTRNHARGATKEFKSKYMKEDLAVPLLGGDQPPRGNSDEAAEMVKTELKALANKAMHLAMQMPDSMHVEPWCQAKIANAKSYVSDVHDYMIYGDHKDEEDEQSDVPMTFPNMNSGNAGQNV